MNQSDNRKGSLNQIIDNIKNGRDPYDGIDPLFGLCTIESRGLFTSKDTR